VTSLDRLKVYIAIIEIRCFTIGEIASNVGLSRKEVDSLVAEMIREDLVTALSPPSKVKGPAIDYGIGRDQRRRLAKKAAHLITHLKETKV
jgi:hypothetical protein